MMVVLAAAPDDAPYPRQADRNESDGPMESLSPQQRNIADTNSPSVGQTTISGCILLVDDDRCIRETLSDILEVVGYRTLQASDAAQALVVLREDAAIDALVTDLAMPGTDGIALIRQARAFRHDLPAILLTGYAEEIAPMSGISGGNVQVLRKPVGCDRLLEQLDRMLRRASDV